ncbi:MAG TPA: NifU family protein [Moheibacter sp.]|nr:NifU family protein [Moheibacter sp.]
MMRVYIDNTPNPNILKFVCDETFTSGAIEFEKNDQALESPMAQELLQFPFVQKVYITANFVAVQKIDGIEWEMVANDLKELINKHLKAETLLLNTKKQEETPYSLYVEMTPNPEVMKFVANKTLYNGIAEAKSIEESEDIPLAQSLFSYEFVQEVFVTDHYVSVTKTPNADWNDIALPIRDHLSNYLKSGAEIIKETYVPAQKNSAKTDFVAKEYSDIEKQIKAILEEYVQPAVAGDGGNIELIEFEASTKTAKMLLQGACSGCPSSTLTLKQGIETMLKDMLPGQIDSVEAING